MKRLTTTALATGMLATAVLAVAAIAPASAADKTDPRCLSYGEGFIYSESTGFCVRVSGSIEGGFVAGSRGSHSDSEARVSLDARKDTDFGPVRVFMQPKGGAFQ